MRSLGIHAEPPDSQRIMNGLVTGRPIKSRRGEHFRAWVAALEAVGFKVDWKVLTCADYGDPTTRRRFFLIGRSDGKRLRWPEPSHDRVGGTDLLGSRQRWRGAREVIDWTMTGNSIFRRKKPLKPNTRAGFSLARRSTAGRSPTSMLCRRCWTARRRAWCSTARRLWPRA